MLADQCDSKLGVERQLHPFAAGRFTTGRGGCLILISGILVLFLLALLSAFMPLIPFLKPRIMPVEKSIQLPLFCRPLRRDYRRTCIFVRLKIWYFPSW